MLMAGLLSALTVVGLAPGGRDEGPGSELMTFVVWKSLLLAPHFLARLSHSLSPFLSFSLSPSLSHSVSLSLSLFLTLSHSLSTPSVTLCPAPVPLCPQVYPLSPLPIFSLRPSLGRSVVVSKRYEQTWSEPCT